jgi:hypothetical protein
MSFCARGKFWEKEPHTHSPPPLSVVGVSNTLILPKLDLSFILDTDASNTIWVVVLLQKHVHHKEVCMHSSRCFKYPELKSPPSIKRYFQLVIELKDSDFSSSLCTL